MSVGSSAFEFLLPDLGEGLEEAEIVRWFVGLGDRVAREQPVCEVQTDKATVELPCPISGRVLRLGGDEGDLLRVGDVLIELDTANGEAPATSRSGAAPDGLSAERESTRRLASPAVRKLALELGVDLHEIHGSGPGGRIVLDDVRSFFAPPPTAIASPPPTSAPPTSAPPTSAPPAARAYGLTVGVHPLRGIRRRVAETMTQSWTTIPHLHCNDEIDATSILSARKRLREEAPDLSLPVFFAKAVAAAMRTYPIANASLLDEEIHIHADVHVGMAVATDAGLLVPVLRNADRRPWRDAGAELRRLLDAARAGRSTPSDLAGGTVTVTNYGSIGGRFANPIIRPPEVCIVGFGAIAPRPIVVDGVVVARPTLPIVVTADHRLVDGDVAAGVLREISRRLADPIRFLID